MLMLPLSNEIMICGLTSEEGDVMCTLTGTLVDPEAVNLVELMGLARNGIAIVS